MGALQMVGLLVTIGAIASFGLYAAIGHSVSSHSNDTAEPPPPPGEEDELRKRLALRVQKDRQRYRERWLYTSCVVLALGVFLLLYSVPPNFSGVTRTPVGQGVGPGANLESCVPVSALCSGAEARPGSSQAAAASFLWPLIGMAGLALVAGVVLLIFGKELWVKIVGAGTMVAGIAGGGSLVHEVKVEKLFGFEMKNEIEAIQLDFRKKMESVDIDAKIEARLAALGAVGPERVTYFEGFESGSATLLNSMDDPMHRACRLWTERTGQGLVGLILVIGATDRVPLGGAARNRYESNFGLARARAEAIRTRLGDDCNIPAGQMLALVSGPRTTPEGRQFIQRERGYPSDRRVDVWALWSWPVPKQSRNVSSESSTGPTIQSSGKDATGRKEAKVGTVDAK